MTDQEGSAENRSLASYLSAVASDEPTPGGGSVVAVCGALSAALAAMVSRLTMGRAGSPTAEDELRSAVGAIDSLRSGFLELAAADEAAYGRYIDATSMPKASDAERTVRRQALQNALIGAAEVPMSVASTCGDLAVQLTAMARLGSHHVLSDISVATWVGEAALRGAVINVLTNARLMKDAERRRWYEDEAARVETTVMDELRRARDVAATRVGQ